MLEKHHDPSADHHKINHSDFQVSHYGNSTFYTGSDSTLDLSIKPVYRIANETVSYETSETHVQGDQHMTSLE